MDIKSKPDDMRMRMMQNPNEVLIYEDDQNNIQIVEPVKMNIYDISNFSGLPTNVMNKNAVFRSAADEIMKNNGIQHYDDNGRSSSVPSEDEPDYQKKEDSILKCMQGKKYEPLMIKNMYINNQVTGR